MTLSLLVQTARYYQGQASNLATGIEGSRHFRRPADVRFTPESGLLAQHPPPMLLAHFVGDARS
jgi:hypothetical protein